jgi:hypothetical protein
MNRRTALKMMGLGAVAAATPVEAEVSDFLDRNWREMASNYKFADWLRENVPLQNCPKIAVVGRPKSGRTNLLTFLLMHYRREWEQVDGLGRTAANRDFQRIELHEAALNRDFNYGSDALGMTYKCDLVLVTRAVFDNEACAGQPIFDVVVAKNRWGEAGSLTFDIGRMPAHDVQRFSMSQRTPILL